jgi:hypothetical protein
MTNRHAQLTVAAAALLALAAGCTNAPNPNPSATPSTAMSASPSAAASPSSAPASPSVSPSAAASPSASVPGGMPSGTVNYSVTDWAIPSGDPLELGSSLGQFPSATLDSVEIGKHPEGSPAYTRISFRIRNAMPSCRLVYVREFTGTDDKPVAVPGNAKLSAVLHTASGPATAVTVTGDGKPVVQGVVKYDDFEGYLAYGIGIQTAAGSDQVRLVRCGHLQYTDDRPAPYVVFVDIQG